MKYFLIKKVEISKQKLNGNLEGSGIGNEDQEDLNIKNKILNEEDVVDQYSLYFEINLNFLLYYHISTVVKKKNQGPFPNFTLGPYIVWNGPASVLHLYN